MLRRVSVTMPVSVAIAKLQTRIDGHDEEMLIEQWIASAVDLVSEDVGFELRQEMWDLTVSDAVDPVVLPRDQVRSLISVSDAGGELTGFDLQCEGRQWQVVGPWPSGDVVIRFETGADLDEMPGLKQAILMLVSHWDWNRDGVSEKPLREIPYAVEDLITRHRRGWVRA